jgi:hypothetical protein
MKFLSDMTSTGDILIDGSLAAVTKSFYIKHPLRNGMMLKYGSLEGPENGVYVRGTSTDNIIQLPDYWIALIDVSTITVSLTPVGKHQKLYVKRIENNIVEIGNGAFFNKDVHYSYVVYAERNDTAKLAVEIVKE